MRDERKFRVGKESITGLGAAKKEARRLVEKEGRDEVAVRYTKGPKKVAFTAVLGTDGRAVFR
jgi:hypothetical protein